MIDGKYYSLTLMVGLIAVAGSSEPGVGNEPAVSYDHDIQPILSARCFRCHGPEKQESGLRLDVRGRALAGGDGGVSIVVGKSGVSELIRRVAADEENDRMPPKGERLTASQINMLRRWIDQGAAGIPENTMPSAKRHWAFQSIPRHTPPAVSDVGWPHNPIDRFVLRKLEDRELSPAPEAARETLIRRLYLDLIGLPPTWSRVVEFVDDPRPNAYEQLVDELLASPRYGERWGRHWLDLARYADSAGYESDQPRKIWAYRDWVIQALNADMPFDQFVTEQLAGDLLPNASIDQRIATGFQCNAMLDPGVRQDSILDRVNTIGAVFLGLTTGCAQCHSHKTDPLTQREFYQLYAFFNDASIAEMQMDGNFYVAPTKSSAATQKHLQAEARPPTTLVMKQTPQPTHIFVRGDRANPGEPVEAGFPAFFNARFGSNLPALIAGSHNHPAESMHLTRLELAGWLLSPENPLPARVTANRVWQRFFGLGLVETESDFGMQTPQPLHSQLLDYLACELRGATSPGWRGLKSLQRLIVTSATYRQSSNSRPELAEVDSGNQLFARQRRVRLEAEIIRDVWLAAADLLSNKLGGPSVFPFQVDGILKNRATPAEWRMSDGEDLYRRGMYTWVWRLTPHPNLPLFDAPDGVTACTRRDRSNVPVQALTLLNDPSFVEAARALAMRIATSSARSDDERIRLLIRTCLSRDPSIPESKLLQNLISQQRQAFGANPNEAAQVSGNSAPPDFDVAEFASWVVVSRVVMNLDEFITRE